MGALPSRLQMICFMPRVIPIRNKSSVFNRFL